MGEEVTASAGAASYADVVKRILSAYAELKPSYGEVEVEAIFDDAQGHYELMYAGWAGGRRVHGSVIHVDLRGGKIWIQHDGTEHGIAAELLDAGIPKEHIVLAFQPPERRKHTPFAVG
ncbi:XisI protein [Sorangium sp. So ce131]|uniref:XisI protein n=1 Tax=Sorangium sp. So ce131 TaxID=3133282 RepID=UPI003F62DDB2